MTMDFKEWGCVGKIITEKNWSWIKIKFDFLKWVILFPSPLSNAMRDNGKNKSMGKMQCVCVRGGKSL